MTQTRSLLLLLAASLAAPTHASDHIDGARVLTAPVADLTDLFAFPKPGDPDRLILILDSFSAAAPGAIPPPDYAFTFVLRSATQTAGEPRFETAGDYRLTCRTDAERTVTCTSSTGTTVTAGWNAAPVDDTAARIALYAGQRSDPFFLNGIWAAKVTRGLELTNPSDNNVLSGFNVLSFVLDISIPDELGDLPGPLYAVAAQVTETETGALHDWVGRAEITNIALQLGTPDLRDAYNALGPFTGDTAGKAQMRDRLSANIAAYNTLKDPDVPAERRDALGALFADDYLLVDPSKPCDKAQYLGIEQAVLMGQPHQGCGGRRPNDDVIDAIYSMLITGQLAPPIEDGVSQATTPATDSFPYLTPPNTGLVDRAWAYIGRALGNYSVEGPSRTTAYKQLAVVLLPVLVLLVGAGLWIRHLVTGRGEAFFAAHRSFTLVGTAAIAASLWVILT